MNLFPKIEHINDILPSLEGKNYIGVNKQSNGATVLCYNISNGECFATPFEKECRGITFDRDGKIVNRPLHKFFNLAEREEVLPQNLNWDDVVAVFDKMDGSMITAGVFHGEVFVKSKSLLNRMWLCRLWLSLKQTRNTTISLSIVHPWI